MSTPGRVTLKQALREYPGDVRSAAARVRDEWRKLTAPRYPRLRLPEKVTPADLSRYPEEERARTAALSGAKYARWFCTFLIISCSAAVFVLWMPLGPVAAAVLFAGVSLELALMLQSAHSSDNLARYGEWVKRPPPQP